MEGKSAAKGYLFGSILATILAVVLFFVAQTDIKSQKIVNGKVVYLEYSSPFEMVLKNILFIVLVIVAIMFYCKTIAAFIKEARTKKIDVLGIDALGSFVEKTETMAINGAKYYTVTFNSVNEKGKSVKCVTSKCFLEEEVIALEKLKNFKVKVMGNLGIIVEDVHRLVLGGDEEIKKVAMQRMVYKCEYCGGEITGEEKTCKQCGAAHKIDISKELKF
jgi:hypothetical protein